MLCASWWDFIGEAHCQSRLGELCQEDLRDLSPFRAELPWARSEINTQAKVYNVLTRVAIGGEVSSRWAKVVKSVSKVEISIIGGR